MPQISANRPVPTPLKTRIAPTPSGFLHIGNALNFALVWMWARSHGARVLLRIDDIDRERVRTAYIEDIFRSLDWLGLDWDEGPQTPDEFGARWSQRHRHDAYAAALSTLTERDAVYACRCSRTEWAHRPAAGCPCQALGIHPAQPETVLRLRSLPGVPFVDRWMGPQTPPTQASDAGTVMRRRDGLPAYQVCSLVDDLHFGVSHGIRGADLIESTHIQLGIATLMDERRFRDIVWMHHPLMVRDGKKMSKSAGSESLEHLRQVGASRAEVVKLLAGWLGAPAAGTFGELSLQVDWARPNFVKNPTT